jgi:O-antigen ligase
VPVLVVNVLRSRRDVERAAAVAGALAAVKGIEGMAAWLLGKGPRVYGTTLTYYSPTANWLMLLFVLCVLAAVLMRVPLPLWARLTAPIAFAALALSFRRNFWIAAALGIVLVVLLARAPISRRLAVPATVVAIAALAIAVTSGSGGRGQNPVIERATSLSPAKLQANTTDRYRIDEERNVLAELRAHPVLGLGLGVPWKARYALSEEHEGGRLYTHVVALWYWLKLGAVGLLAYVWLMAAGIIGAHRLSARGATPLLRAVGLGVAVGFLGLAVAETTGSFTGVDVRFTILVPVVLGWVAAALRVAVADRSQAA